MNSFPNQLNIKRFIEKQQALNGSVRLRQMERLLSMIQLPVDKDLVVKVSLSGSKDLAGYPVISGQISVDLPLICQRCLTPMNYAIKREILLSPVENEPNADILPSQYEPLFFNGETVNLTHLIEDELILALPVVPKHEEADCEATKSPLLQQKNELASETHRPFEGLAKKLNLQRNSDHGGTKK